MQLFVRTDGLTNITNGMGGKSDGFANSEYSFVHALNGVNFNQYYKHNGLIKKIIDLPSTDATRNWITIEKDTDNKALAYLQRMNFKSHLTNALKITRLHGSALIVLNVSDGEQVLSQPVDLNRIKDISISSTFAPSQFAPILDEVNILSYDAYQITGDTMRSSAMLKIHKSRTLLLTNSPLFADPLNKFNESTIFQVHDDVKRLDFIYNITTKLMEICQYDVLEIDKEVIKELSEQGKTDVEIGQYIRTKLQALDKSKSVYGSMAITSGDNIQRLQANFSNYDNIITKVQEKTAAVSNIPMSLLFGSEKSNKLSSSGDGELEYYYNFINGIQENTLYPVIFDLLTLVSKILKFDATVFVFNALWQQSESEKIDNRLKQAQIDKIYLESGVASELDVANSRFGGNGYSFETQVDLSAIAETALLDGTFSDPAKLIQSNE